MPPEEARIDVEEGEADRADKGEVGLEVGRGEVVEEDAADAAPLAPVRQVEVLVAPSLKARVIAGIGTVASGLQRRVERGGIPASGKTGVRSAPPPNQRLRVTIIRVFMCAAGASGERGCTTTEMPEAQKRPSSAAPGMRARKASENSPATVETLTPAFSSTRPRSIAITPPPPPGRSHASRAKRPDGRSPDPSSSIASKAVISRSRSSSNQRATRAPDASRGMSNRPVESVAQPVAAPE